jgi:hypothetical protein
MRALVFATMLLASSSLYPAFAQNEGKASVAGAPQTVPAQTNPDFPPQDQRTGSDQSKADNREVGRDGRMHHGEGDRLGTDDRMGRDDRMGMGYDDRMGHAGREVGRDWRMYRDHEAGRDTDRERYRGRGDRDWDRADRDAGYRGYYDEDRPRRRMKVCVEHENGDEYCHYKPNR